MVAADRTSPPPAAFEPARPPIVAIAVTSMMLVVAGGIYTAAYLPQTAPLAPTVVLVALSILGLIANVVALSRLESFAWERFFQVGRWALVAYLIIAGMLEYVFLIDGMRGNLLILFTLMLAIYAVDVPLILAYSVARYQQP